MSMSRTLTGMIDTPGGAQRSMEFGLVDDGAGELGVVGPGAAVEVVGADAGPRVVASDLAAQDSNLVAEHHDLDDQVLLTTA